MLDQNENSRYGTLVEHFLGRSEPVSRAVMYDVRDIANFILEFAEGRGLKLTNLALQKLLYFAHGWFYAIYEEPLIKNKFEAWKYGPVQRVIYDQFKSFRDAPLRDIRATYINPLTGDPVYREPHIDLDHGNLVRGVLEKYERFTASQLVEASHVEDGPWEYVWQQAEDSIYPGMKIPDALILDHFKRLNPVITLH